MGIRLTSLLALLIGGSFVLCPRNAVCQKQVDYTQVVEQATPSVSLTSSAHTAPWGTSVTFTAKLTGSGAPPSGIVTFRNGVMQLGTGTPNSSGIATYSTSVLGAGSYSITAAYGGDSNYVSATSSALAVSVVCLTPVVTVTPSSTAITTAQALPVVVSVSGGAGTPTPTGSVTLTGGSYASAASALAGGLAKINIPAGSLPVGTATLTASYMPGTASFSTYNDASNTALVVVTAAPSFAISGTSITVRAGKITGNTSIITVTPQSGFIGSVSLTAAISSRPVGALNVPALTFGSSSPVVISGPNAGTASLTVSTTEATDVALFHPERPRGRWHAAAGEVLACALLFCIPVRRRRWQSILGLLLLLLTLAGGTTGCGGFWTQRIFRPPTTAGTYTVTVTGTSGTATAIATTTISLTVE